MTTPTPPTAPTRSTTPARATAPHPVPRAAGRPRRWRHALVSALALLAVLTTGCGDRPALETTAVPRPAPTTAGAPPTPASPRPTDTPSEQATSPAEDGPALTIRATGELAVHDVPGGEPTRTLPATTAFGSRTVALVTRVGEGPADGWLEVLLPTRPNGSTGWVRADAVELRELDLAVVVDLDARELVVREDGREVVRTAVAIGDPDHPTPTGTFYVTDKLETPDPGGAYGPYAIGLSAHSDVLTEFAGGDGQVGLHGTNDPASIGQDVSHGCVRVPNEVVEELAHLLPLGTPVTVT